MRVGTKMQKERIESLTDLVFGLALSLTALALIIRTQETLPDLLRNLAVFAFSFIIVISVWLSYSNVLEHIRVESALALWLNVALLLLVAFEPYLLDVMAFDEQGLVNGDLANGASALYALDLGLIWLIMGALYHLALREEGDPQLVRWRNSRIIDAGVFLVSAAPVFWTIELLDTPIRFWMWVSLLPIGAVRDRWVDRRWGTKNE